MISIMIAAALLDTFVTQMTDAFVSTFNISEWQTDRAYSIALIIGLLLGVIWGIILAKFGGLTYYAILSYICMIIA